jgi:hypothetical protein
VLFCRSEVGFLLEHEKANVDDVAQQIVEIFYLLKGLLKLLPEVNVGTRNLFSTSNFQV